MRRPLVGQGHGSGGVGLTFRLGQGEAFEATRQARQFDILAGDDLGEVVGHASQVGQSFFQPVQAVALLLVHVITFGYSGA